MEYEKYLEKNRDAMIASLQKVIRINSEEKDPVTDSDGRIYPFGAGVQEALEATLEIGRQLGFEVRNVDNYGGHIDLPGKNGKIMAIIGHLDVVPAGSGWSHEPYGGEIADGKMYGRGTLDDKGPVISCLYAMKALKDAGFVPEPTVRLILGLDEESGWKGIKYYFEKVGRCQFFISDYPAVSVKCTCKFVIMIHNGKHCRGLLKLRVVFYRTGKPVYYFKASFPDKIFLQNFFAVLEYSDRDYTCKICA